MMGFSSKCCKLFGNCWQTLKLILVWQHVWLNFKSSQELKYENYLDKITKCFFLNTIYWNLKNVSTNLWKPKNSHYYKNYKLKSREFSLVCEFLLSEKFFWRKRLMFAHSLANATSKLLIMLNISKLLNCAFEKKTIIM